MWLVLALLVLLFMVYSAVGERGFIRFAQMAERRDSLRERVRDLQRENAELAQEIDLLRSDPATIEYLARTELGMVKDGETVYILSERPGDDGQ